MDSLEQKFIYPHTKYPRIWFRFTDDIWGIFRDTEKELYSFVEYKYNYIEYNQTIKSSIPHSQFLRMRRNCTQCTEFIKHSVQLLSYLSLRGYPSNLTISALHRCNNISQHEALLPKEKTESDDKSLFCITEFNPLNSPICEWIHELWPILYRSSVLEC